MTTMMPNKAMIKNNVSEFAAKGRTKVVPTSLGLERRWKAAFRAGEGSISVSIQVSQVVS
jgi:hypothetical protein